MRTIQPIQPKTQQAIDETRAWLRARVLALAKNPALAALIGQARADQITAQVNAEDGLTIARNVVHVAIVECGSGPNGILWDVNDAINFFLDTKFGRWAYMTDSDRERNLTWCREGIESVELALAAEIGAQPVAA